jgi:hypothetical protein
MIANSRVATHVHVVASLRDAELGLGETEPRGSLSSVAAMTSKIFSGDAMRPGPTVPQLR